MSRMHGLQLCASLRSPIDPIGAVPEAPAALEVPAQKIDDRAVQNRLARRGSWRKPCPSLAAFHDLYQRRRLGHGLKRLCWPLGSLAAPVSNTNQPEPGGPDAAIERLIFRNLKPGSAFNQFNVGS